MLQQLTLPMPIIIGIIIMPILTKLPQMLTSGQSLPTIIFIIISVETALMIMVLKLEVTFITDQIM